jgi:hypothetical protein
MDNTTHDGDNPKVQYFRILEMGAQSSTAQTAPVCF